MTPQEVTTVAVELERLRGAVDTGFATLNGRLDTALQRTSQAEKDIADLETKVDKELDELGGRVSSLERGRWPLPTIGALTGVAGAVTAVLALIR
ncbi:hypothetical protein AB0891_25580 [Streptomyces sp. NPDC007259]|uniref:hypothetical protein n=1 Tax=Streptomyces sp. NPDC007259 TaxID=3154319 RepID=UPI0034551CA7